MTQGALVVLPRCAECATRDERRVAETALSVTVPGRLWPRRVGRPSAATPRHPTPDPAALLGIVAVRASLSVWNARSL